jgi:hypothetical protein
MKTLITENNIHVWENDNPLSDVKLNVSFENTKEFATYKTVDACVDDLWLKGFKHDARQVNDRF